MICPAPMPVIRKPPSKEKPMWRVRWSNGGEWTVYRYSSEDLARARYVHLILSKRYVQLVRPNGRVVAD